MFFLNVHLTYKEVIRFDLRLFFQMGGPKIQQQNMLKWSEMFLWHVGSSSSKRSHTFNILSTPCRVLCCYARCWRIFKRRLPMLEWVCLILKQSFIICETLLCFGWKGAGFWGLVFSGVGLTHGEWSWRVKETIPVDNARPWVGTIKSIV